MKTKLFSIVLILVALSAMAFTLFIKSNALSVYEFNDKINSKESQLVDIRDYKAYLSAHIENSLNIDYKSKSF